MNNLPYFEVYKDTPKGKWNWVCKSVNNCIIARGSEEGYSNKWGCRGAVKRLIVVLRAGVGDFEIRDI